MKIGVIDVGGGFRGIYAAGVLDHCMEQEIWFDYGIGVSAGSANLASYMARQPGRNRRFMEGYSLRKEAMSGANLLKKGGMIDLEYTYGELSKAGGEDPLDYAALAANPAEMVVVASEAVSGKVRYFTKADVRQDDYGIFMASSTLPGFCRPYEVNGVLYYDGGLSDPVPIEKAFADGCDRVVLILTKPRNLVRSSQRDDMMARLLRPKYPKAAENLHLRAQRYNTSVAKAKLYERQGRVLIVAPESTDGVDTLCRDVDAIERLYQRGRADARAIEPFYRAARGQ